MKPAGLPPTQRVALNNLIAHIRHCRLAILNMTTAEVVREHALLYQEDKKVPEGWQSIEMAEDKVSIADLWDIVHDQLAKFERDLTGRAR